jgi:hypothetical protein
MATFKFFLQVYAPFPLVEQEYARYYEMLHAPQDDLLPT